MLFTHSGACRQHDATTFTEADARMTGFYAVTAHDDFIAIIEELAFGAIAELNWFGSAPGSLEQTAARIFGRS